MFASGLLSENVIMNMRYILLALSKDHVLSDIRRQAALC